MDIETEYIPNFDSYPQPAAKKLWVEDYDRMIVHTQGKPSSRLINTRRPNESEDVKKYRIDNFRPVTQAAFNQASDNAKRVLSHSSVEVIYPEKIKDFMFSDSFNGTDYMNYKKNYYFDKMIDAANAFMVWWPIGQIGDVTKQVSVEPIIVMPEDVVHATDEVFTFLSSEKSWVEVGQGESAPIGQVFYIIGEKEIWKKSQVGRIDSIEFEYAIYAVNPCGYVYPYQLGGKETIVEIEGKNRYGQDDEIEVKYFKSFFSHALAYADECLARFSDNQGVAVRCSSPLMEVESVKCTAGCKNGFVEMWDSEKKKILGTTACETCHGRGKVPITGSPYGVITRPERQKGVGEFDNTDIPTVRFIHPEVGILDYSDRTWQDYLKMTKDSLALLRIDQAQSGVAKEIDRENQLSVLDVLAAYLYKGSVVQDFMIIHKFLYPSLDFPQVTINLPSSFIIKSPGEILEDIKILRDQGAPDFIIIEKTREYIQKAYGSDQFRMKIFDVLVALDPVFIKTQNEISQLVSSTVITNEQATFHLWATSIVESYAKEQGRDFVTMDTGSIVTLLKPKIDQKVAEEMASVSAL